MKEKSIVKFKLAIILIIALAFSNFAAIVSDNDGSAFVSKAEFDALRIDFSNQIDNYNKSLDGKIDGAIAAYLAGIKLSEKFAMPDYVEAALKNNKNNVTFANWHATPSCLGRSEHDIEALYYVAGSQGPSGQARVSGRYYGWTIFKNDDVWVRGSYIKYPWGASDTNERYQDYMYWGYFVDRKKIEKGWYLYDTNMHRCKFTLQCDAANFDNGDLGTPNNYINSSSVRTLTSDFLTRKRPGKVKEEKNFQIMTNLNIKMPLWMSHTWSYPELTITSAGVSKSTGTSKEKENNKTKQAWMAYMNGSYVATNSMVVCEYNYKDEYPDDNADDYPDKKKNIEYNIQIQRSPESTGTAKDKTGVQSSWWRQTTAQSSLTGGSQNVKFMWKYRKQKSYSLNSYDIVSKYWNDITQLSKSHYLYNGIVIARVNKVGTAKFSFNIVADTSKSKTTYTYAISDRPFANEYISDKDIEGTGNNAYNHILAYGENVKLGKLDVEIKKEKIFDKFNGDFIYLKISPDTEKHVVHVESAGVPTYVTE